MGSEAQKSYNNTHLLVVLRDAKMKEMTVHKLEEMEKKLGETDKTRGQTDRDLRTVSTERER